MDDTLFKERAITLEETFFAQHNRELLDRLKEKAEREEQRKLLAEALQISDDTVLDHLVELELNAECAMAFGLVPLVEVAWADGRIDAPEREAILKAAADSGCEEGSIPAELLKAWLEAKPPGVLLDAWREYVRALKESLSAAEMAEIRDKLLGRARAVAEAAGGFLGLGAKVSGREKAVLEELEQALS
jgi:hypothetical protein